MDLHQLVTTEPVMLVYMAGEQWLIQMRELSCYTIPLT